MGEALKDKDNLGEGELNLEFKVVMEKKGTQANTEYQFPGTRVKKLRGIIKNDLIAMKHIGV